QFRTRATAARDEDDVPCRRSLRAPSPRREPPPPVGAGGLEAPADPPPPSRRPRNRAGCPSANRRLRRRVAARRNVYAAALGAARPARSRGADSWLGGMRRLDLHVVDR